MKYELADGVKVVCELLRVDEHTICVEFNRLEGGAFEFQKHYKEIVQRLSLYNDAVLSV